MALKCLKIDFLRQKIGLKSWPQMSKNITLCHVRMASEEKTERLISASERETVHGPGTPKTWFCWLTDLMLLHCYTFSNSPSSLLGSKVYPEESKGKCITYVFYVMLKASSTPQQMPKVD